MNARWKTICFAVVVLGLILIAVTRSRNQSQGIPALVSQETSVAQTPISSEPTPQPQLQPTPKTETIVKARVQNPPPARNNPTNPGKELLQDPAARAALAQVGSDPDAEQYWLGAIFDTSLPDNERGDLMEDLNETGFDDPKNLTADDLPLIVSRLEIIDAVLPAADDFMTDHLLEAQKDLVNMFADVTGQQ